MPDKFPEAFVRWEKWLSRKHDSYVEELTWYQNKNYLISWLGGNATYRQITAFHDMVEGRYITSKEQRQQRVFEPRTFTHAGDVYKKVYVTNRGGKTKRVQWRFKGRFVKNPLRED